jgi:lipopolysaccharide transport system permease protein
MHLEAGVQPPKRFTLLRLLSPEANVRAYRELGSLLSRKRALTWEMAKRELSTEHAGKHLGRFWGIFQPLALLTVYAVVYGVVFRAKIGGTYTLPRNYTVYLLSGLVPWFAFQLSMVKSAAVIPANAALVKQVVFELSVLPIATALAACLSLVLGIGFLFGYTGIVYGALPWTYVLVPALVVFQFLAMSGVAFALSALGAFVRDVRDIVQLSSIVLIFLMPIVYLPGDVPAAFDPILWLNPFTYMVYCFQDALYFGRIEHPVSWVAFGIGSILVFSIGYRLFRRVRPFFGNVL